MFNGEPPQTNERSSKTVLTSDTKGSQSAAKALKAAECVHCKADTSTKSGKNKYSHLPSKMKKCARCSTDAPSDSAKKKPKHSAVTETTPLPQPITVMRSCKYCGALNAIDLASVLTPQREQKFTKYPAAKSQNLTKSSSSKSSKSTKKNSGSSSDISLIYLNAYEKNLGDENRETPQETKGQEHFENWHIWKKHKNESSVANNEDKIDIEEYSEAFKDINTSVSPPNSLLIPSYADNNTTDVKALEEAVSQEVNLSDTSTAQGFSPSVFQQPFNVNEKSSDQESVSDKRFADTKDLERSKISRIVNDKQSSNDLKNSKSDTLKRSSPVKLSFKSFSGGQQSDTTSSASLRSARESRNMYNWTSEAFGDRSMYSNETNDIFWPQATLIRADELKTNLITDNCDSSAETSASRSF